MDKYKPRNFKYSELIQYVEDRPGHDYRYSIDASKIKKDLGWHPKILSKRLLNIQLSGIWKKSNGLN